MPKNIIFLTLLMCVINCHAGKTVIHGKELAVLQFIKSAEGVSDCTVTYHNAKKELLAVEAPKSVKEMGEEPFNEVSLITIANDDAMTYLHKKDDKWIIEQFSDDKQIEALGKKKCIVQ
ncbi:hypothetical protein HYX58_02845 [Candidatus Dependentiae bacterium]|nr:hypothetical protein [Candidatus Dependentiae bacterium]